MPSQLGVVVRRVGVGVAGGGEDRAALDTRLETLFAECQAFKFFEAVAVGCAAVGRESG